jgi:luciferase family oxidoreductase group 1
VTAAPVGDDTKWTLGDAERNESGATVIPFSILDLAPIVQGGTAADALRNTVSLARHAERLGYLRFWLAEHHNMPGIASAATAVVIGQVAAATTTMRIGAGGIMLPNHAPLIVAEQFGTLESLFPGRIDLGLGRAPGTDHTTARALRRTLVSDPEAFPHDVLELMQYFSPRDGQSVRAVPGSGLKVPIYILGSSLFGARVAAAFGLPFAFASHFAPAAMMQALEVYRSGFQPSEQLQAPHAILGVNVVAAATDAEARFLASSGREAFASLRRGMPIALPPPSREFEKDVVPFGQIPLTEVTSIAMVGSPSTVADGLRHFVAQTSADELMIVSHIYDHEKRLESYRIAAEARHTLD